jgi:hypothetical protein
MFNETRTPCLIGCTEMGKEMKKSKKKKKKIGNENIFSYVVWM